MPLCISHDPAATHIGQKSFLIKFGPCAFPRTLQPNYTGRFARTGNRRTVHVQGPCSPSHRQAWGHSTSKHTGGHARTASRTTEHTRNELETALLNPVHGCCLPIGLRLRGPCSITNVLQTHWIIELQLSIQKRLLCTARAAFQDAVVQCQLPGGRPWSFDITVQRSNLPKRDRVSAMYDGV